MTLPLRALDTIGVIYFLSFTLSTFTLLGLSLAIGIVVDDAILVLENIFRHAEQSTDRIRGARESSAEITFVASPSLSQSSRSLYQVKPRRDQPEHRLCALANTAPKINAHATRWTKRDKWFWSVANSPIERAARAC